MMFSAVDYWRKKMYYYKLYGFKVVSDIEFSQLVVCTDEMEPDIEIKAGGILQWIFDKEQDGIKYEFGDEISWLSNKTCCLLIEKGRKLTYHLKEGGNPVYLQAYLLGWGMSMLALQRGIIAMHCSAVADEKGAVIISGRSGSGKSTLTGALLTRGYRLMADDMALVEETKEGIMVRPAFPYQKLCRDAAAAQGYCLEELKYINEKKDKFLVPYRGIFSTEPVRIKGFILLGFTEGNEIIGKEVEGIQKFRIIVNNQFLQALLGDNKYKPALGQKCLKIAAGTPIYDLLRPAGRETVRDVMTKALDIIRECDERVEESFRI